jgi:hypothetical protein
MRRPSALDALALRCLDPVTICKSAAHDIRLKPDVALAALVSLVTAVVTILRMAAVYDDVHAILLFEQYARQDNHITHPYLID